MMRKPTRGGKATTARAQSVVPTAAQSAIAIGRCATHLVSTPFPRTGRCVMSGPRPDQHKAGRHFVTDLWRLVQLSVALWLLYSLAAHTVWLASQVFSGQAKVLGAAGLAAAGPVAGAIGIIIPLPGPLAELIIACIVG